MRSSEGRNQHQPRLRDARDESRARATFIFTKLDRLARSVRDVSQSADDLAARESKLSISGSVYDLPPTQWASSYSTPRLPNSKVTSSGSERRKEGRKIPRAKGRLRGKKPKASPKQEALLVQLHGAGEHTMSELADLFPAGRSIVYRTLDRAGFSEAAAEAKKPGQGQ
ncbi:recombinase family protein [Arthrobacter sp. ZGTC412]|uniref:recombinase family protein n=1 Tax=Arthrobacter sp. ZGTC412 TaxID=2058900 RepID=UPI003F8D6EB9